MYARWPCQSRMALIARKLARTKPLDNAAPPVAAESTELGLVVSTFTTTVSLSLSLCANAPPAITTSNPRRMSAFHRISELDFLRTFIVVASFCTFFDSHTTIFATNFCRQHFLTLLPRTLMHPAGL